MKAPVLSEIPVATPDTSFTERAKVTKKSAPQKPKAVKKSHSLTADDVSYIEKLALKLGQKRGKSMSESEALRVIINDHRRQK